MPKNTLNIAIPSNVLENCKDLRSKTQKIGQIGRACAIFRVKKIIIYSINKNFSIKFAKDIELINIILKYLDCPQYLRRFIFPKSPLLRYVGLLPPLRTPHHPTTNKISELVSDSIREGAVIYSNHKISEVDIGVEKPIKVDLPKLPLKSRIILRIKKNKGGIYVKPINRIDVGIYWGYEIQVVNKSVKNFMEKFKHCLIIATSRYGNPLKRKDLHFFQPTENKELLILFGSPNYGLFQIFEDNALKLDEMVHFILNIAPYQGTETIHVEEAILSTLSIINQLISL